MKNHYLANRPQIALIHLSTNINMKKILFLSTLYLLLINSSFSQYKHPLIENVEIELESYGVKKNVLDGAKLECSKDLTSLNEIRHRVYFSAKFFDFSTKKTLDFNNISLVDVDNKIRYRPDGVIQYGFSNSWFADKVVLIESEDSFNKYSQEGIENFDFYSKVDAINFQTNKKNKYRLKPEAFKRKANLKLTFSFPVFKTPNDSG
ncbi:MAG TPA: hypothetical protein VFQ50_11695, partial [Flavobacterium sp.]|nr:hypothetical protein [Flavobacterium sp.]